MLGKRPRPGHEKGAGPERPGAVWGSGGSFLEGLGFVLGRESGMMSCAPDGLIHHELPETSQIRSATAEELPEILALLERSFDPRFAFLPTLEELRRIRDARVPGHVPDDRLRRLARLNIERLKYAGDHTVLPHAAEDFAAGRFFADGKRIGFLADGADRVLPALTVEYRADGSRRLLESTL